MAGYERQWFTDFTGGAQFYAEYMMDHDAATDARKAACRAAACRLPSGFGIHCKFDLAVLHVDLDSARSGTLAFDDQHRQRVFYLAFDLGHHIAQAG